MRTAVRDKQLAEQLVEVPDESWLRFCRRCCPNPWVEDSSGDNRAVR